MKSGHPVCVGHPLPLQGWPDGHSPGEPVIGVTDICNETIPEKCVINQKRFA